MRATFSNLVRVVVLGSSVFLVAAQLAGASSGVIAEESQPTPSKSDQERIKGTWRIVDLKINGNQVADADARKLAVVNGPGNVWSLVSDGKEVARGTNRFEPTKTPKEIDFTITDGSGKSSDFLGIYELGDSKRKLCFAPAGKERPAQFSSTPQNGCILVIFEREK
jgi:uncharacterized protein (TIGR03067 family)